MINET